MQIDIKNGGKEFYSLPPFAFSCIETYANNFRSLINNVILPTNLLHLVISGLQFIPTRCRKPQLTTFLCRW